MIISEDDCFHQQKDHGIKTMVSNIKATIKNFFMYKKHLLYRSIFPLSVSRVLQVSVSSHQSLVVKSGM